MRFKVPVVAAVAAAMVLGGGSAATAEKLDGPTIGRCSWQTDWWEDNIGGDSSYGVACMWDPGAYYDPVRCMYYEKHEGRTVCHEYPEAD